MRERLMLGAAAGVIVSAAAWGANQTPHTVVVVPGGLTFLLFVALICGTVWLHFRRSRPVTAAASLWAAETIAVTAGLVFGASLIALGVDRFSHPVPSLLAFGFVIAVMSALACGALAGAIVKRLGN